MLTDNRRDQAFQAREAAVRKEEREYWLARELPHDPKKTCGETDCPLCSVYDRPR